MEAYIDSIYRIIRAANRRDALRRPTTTCIMYIFTLTRVKVYASFMIAGPIEIARFVANENGNRDARTSSRMSSKLDRLWRVISRARAVFFYLRRCAVVAGKSRGDFTRIAEGMRARKKNATITMLDKNTFDYQVVNFYTYTRPRVNPPFLPRRKVGNSKRILAMSERELLINISDCFFNQTEEKSKIKSFIFRDYHPRNYTFSDIQYICTH